MNNDSVFKALSDHNRRKIIKLLRKETEMNAGDIAAHFHISKPAISEHLKILRQADLIFSEKKGQYILYSLNTSVIQEVVSFFYDFINDSK